MILSAARNFQEYQGLRMAFKTFPREWTFDVEILARFILFERFMDSPP
jgi:hypothetical protein